ncbi:NADH-quinone oxidoreductase subunit NuoG [Candidatus Erwinia haradaeae]|uniref:NADH-quinone oxidoreductase n=1 Tax=Candidatus Erwinia haradaeae TaxID=1922217 RepID=A0A803FTP4_9GAMM|nr:NADH-quinone oxidoreductase subunit NuoG [Candidatus Erwinia haradaeae]VFP87233.1 NADH-quinone oxidoreductase subunit G [Candidatus Erwinia haradaeae]
MSTIYVDGQEYKVHSSDNLLHACLSFGLNIPYFCWHPALGSVGSCRQCAVKKYKSATDSRGQLVMSCMTPADDGSCISINDTEAQEFRKSMIELLMINHPHDCPVCEEGGHCHLQDMTVMSGHSLRRYRFTKRTHYNQNLGPFIAHEMNRCISCYRCVRYYNNYADGNDLGVYGVHDNIYFGRISDGVLDSEFSGNLVEICPTGVFTDKTHSECYNRKWDMQFAPSICQQCSIGCNISPGERYGELRRIDNCYHGMINQYFLCDLGRFGYGYVNLKDRPRSAIKRDSHGVIALNSDEAVHFASTMLCKSKKVIGIGSVRASIESNFALFSLVGKENFSSGMPEGEQSCLNLILQILRNSGIHTPSLREIESYDAILILGEDLTQTSARMALSVRQAVKGKASELALQRNVLGWHSAAIGHIGLGARYPLFLTNVDVTRLDDIAKWTYYAPVEDQARFAFAIAHRLDDSAPPVPDLDKNVSNYVEMIAQTFISAKKPLIITGTHSGSAEIIQAAANIAKALSRRLLNVGISLVSSASNSLGLGLMGGHSLNQALKKLGSGESDTVIILENDLYRHAPKYIVDDALSNARAVIVLDHQYTRTTNRASLVFSSASFAESDGTVINYEGRAQRFFQVYDPSYYNDKIEVLASWRWLHFIQCAMNGSKTALYNLDDIINDCILSFPSLAGIKKAAPNADFRIFGQKLSRSPHRFSGRTAIRSDISVHEPRQPQDLDTMFAFSMEGNNQPDALRSHIPFVWSPGWNSPQAWNKFQDKVGGHLRNGDPGQLIFKKQNRRLDWFTNIPKSFVRSVKSWRISPYFHLFGSDEMTQKSSVIQQRMPKPYLMINFKDAEILQVHEGELLEFTCYGETICLPVSLSSQLQWGQVGLPLGFPGIGVFLRGADISNLRRVL